MLQSETELMNCVLQCEQFRAEATALPALRAEFDSLRRRHTSALELMGERDEEVVVISSPIVSTATVTRFVLLRLLCFTL